MWISLDFCRFIPPQFLFILKNKKILSLGKRNITFLWIFSFIHMYLNVPNKNKWTVLNTRFTWILFMIKRIETWDLFIIWLLHLYIMNFDKIYFRNTILPKLINQLIFNSTIYFYAIPMIYLQAKTNISICIDIITFIKLQNYSK